MACGFDDAGRRSRRPHPERPGVCRIPRRAAISFKADAVSSACARLSIWHGPAISASGSFAPNFAANGPLPT